MLTTNELAGRIRGLVNGDETLIDFEEWFSVHSRGFHRSGDPALIDFVSAVESKFSGFYFQGMSEERTKTLLGDEADRFAPRAIDVLLPSAVYTAFRPFYHHRNSNTYILLRDPNPLQHVQVAASGRMSVRITMADGDAQIWSKGNSANSTVPVGSLEDAAGIRLMLEAAAEPV